MSLRGVYALGDLIVIARYQDINKHMFPVFIIGLIIFGIFNVYKRFYNDASILVYYAPTALKPLVYFHQYTTANAINFAYTTYYAMFDLLLRYIPSDYSYYSLFFNSYSAISFCFAFITLFAIYSIAISILDIFTHDKPGIKLLILLTYIITMIFYFSMFYWVKGIA